MDFALDAATFTALLAGVAAATALGVAAVLGLRGAFLAPAITGKVVSTSVRGAGIKS